MISEDIQKAIEKIDKADAVLITAGAGINTHQSKRS